MVKKWRTEAANQDNEDTHLTSKSLVATPDCNIDLNRIVSGNGSFTTMSIISCRFFATYASTRHTNNKAAKERVDPAHD